MLLYASVPITFFYVLYMFEGRENNESILNSDTGISSDSAHSLTLVFEFFFIFKNKTLPVDFFFLNVIATKIYVYFLKIVNLLYDVR